MGEFIVGLLVFFGVHMIPTFPDAHARLLRRLGDQGYKAIFSIVSLIGFVMIVLGFASIRGTGADPQIWNPPVWARHITFLLMLPMVILLVAAYVPSKIRDRVKHPMLAAVKLWALGHLLANGDLAGMILFGSFLAWAIYDRISVKRRGALGPLGAKHAASSVNDAIVVGVGALIWAALLFGGHGWLFGAVLLR